MRNIQKKFSKIYNKHIDKIFRYVYLKVSSREIAEDLCSETFLRGWNAFQNQEAKIENPQAFLYQIARNLIADHYRQNSQFKTVSAEQLQVSDPRSDLEEEVILGSDINNVRQALSLLKKDYQDVIVWHYLDELSIKEVAEIMEKSEQAVRVTLHRALKSLRKEIEK